MSIAELREAMALAKVELQQASNKADGIAKELAAAIALEKGIAIGTIMTCTKEQGYSPNKKTVVKRARVTSIRPSYGRDGIELIGVTIRKDGTDGERRELYSFDNWQKETM